MIDLLLKVQFGSRLYGTNTPESDTDYKSVFIPHGRDIIMQSFPRVITKSTGNDKEKNSKEDVDDEQFSMMKYFDMLRDGDMVATELLYIKEDNPNIIFMDDRWILNVHNERNYLVSRNVKGFIGYIRKQANRYGIRGSRVATARAACDLSSELINLYGTRTKLRDIDPNIFIEFVATNEHAEFIDQPCSYNSNKVERYIEILNRKISFNVSLIEMYNIVQRVFQEYGERALAAERNEGVDWKSLYHAIRVSEQAKELLETQNITFPRPNAEELLEIKKGVYPYMQIAERLEDNLTILESLMSTSQLSESVDESYMDGLLENYHLEAVNKYQKEL